MDCNKWESFGAFLTLQPGVFVELRLTPGRQHQKTPNSDSWGWTYLSDSLQSGPSHGWQRLLAYSKGKEPPAFLSDHPSSEQRIADIKRELPEAKAAFVAHK